MSGPELPAPDAEAGKALRASLGDEISVDSQDLIAYASALMSRVELLTAEQAELDSVKEKTEPARAAFSAEWEPEGTFDTCVEAGEGKGHATAGTLSSTVKGFTTAAAALLWIAENMDSTQAEASAKVEGVPAEELLHA